MKTFANIKNSTDKKNILHILSDISNGIFHSQRKISRQLGISAGLANSYVKRCLKKGWIKLQTVPKKRYIYYLTPKGFTIKSKLTAEYLYSTFKYFRDTRDGLEEIIKTCKKRKYKKILLFGKGDLTEIAILFLKNFDLDFAGATDLEKNYKKDLKRISYDCIWVTDMLKPQISHNILKKNISPKIIFFPRILRIKKEKI